MTDQAARVVFAVSIVGVLYYLVMSKLRPETPTLTGWTRSRPNRWKRSTHGTQSSQRQRKLGIWQIAVLAAILVAYAVAFGLRTTTSSWRHIWASSPRALFVGVALIVAAVVSVAVARWRSHPGAR
jgi:ABC-type anion transport system duplicated permease subunit